MNKPNGYDEAQASGEWEAPKVGGHYLIIRDVKEKQSQTGRDMIVVEFDFAPNDAQPGLFAKDYQNDTRPDKKWPNGGTSYVMVQDYNDQTKTSKSFKTFCTAVERSNPGFEIVWRSGAEWGRQFINKSVGAVFGLVENEYNGRTSVRSELRWFCSAESVATAKVPDEKYLNSGSGTQPSKITGDEDFLKTDPSDSEEVPF